MAEPVYEYGGQRLTAQQLTELDEWATRRPAPRVRSNAEIRSSLMALVALAKCGDRRCEALAKGGYFAARWISGESIEAPASTRELPDPNFYEVAKEIETAGRAAAGVQVFPNASWCDKGRIAARGVEEWLAWVFVQGYPTPIWLVPGAPLHEVQFVLGEVGIERPGWPGLLGPFPSRGRFAYDVADLVPGA